MSLFYIKHQGIPVLLEPKIKYSLAVISGGDTRDRRSHIRNKNRQAYLDEPARRYLAGENGGCTSAV